MAVFLNEYLARLRNVDGAGLALTDRHGVVVTRQGQINPAGAQSSQRLGATSMVPGSPYPLFRDP